VHWISGVTFLETNTQEQLTVTIHSRSHSMNYATFPQLFSLHSVHWISGANPLENNTQAQLTVTIYSGSHNVN